MALGDPGVLGFPVALGDPGVLGVPVALGDPMALGDPRVLRVMLGCPQGAAGYLGFEVGLLGGGEDVGGGDVEVQQDLPEGRPVPGLAVPGGGAARRWVLGEPFGATGGEGCTGHGTH